MSPNLYFESFLGNVFGGFAFGLGLAGAVALLRAVFHFNIF